jgi:hypothetical protein
MARIKGRCLCGAVAYEVSGAPETAFYCHCGRCRRWTGSALAALMVVKSDRLTVTKGRDCIETYREAGHVNRSFCRTCGSSLFGFQWPDGPGTVIPMGTIEGEPGVRPAMHINVEFKASWHEITDDLRQEPGFPGG